MSKEVKLEPEKLDNSTIRILYNGSVAWRHLRKVDRVRFKGWIGRLTNMMDNEIMYCVGRDNRIDKEEMMQKLFLEVPTDARRYDEYVTIIKRIFRDLKSKGRPYISCKGKSNKGAWGYCIPDNDAFYNYDGFLNGIKNGIQKEQDRSEKVFKSENKVEEVERDKLTGQVVATKKKVATTSE